VWPGVFNPDSQFILLAARSHTVSNYYAPLHGWAWSLLDGAGVPAGMVFLLSVMGFVSAVLMLLKQFLSAGAARLTAAFVVLFPPVYGLLGLVGRDVWFATAALLISALAWRMLSCPDSLPVGTAVGMVVLAVVAADSRQNGAPFAALAFGLVVTRLLRRLRPQAVLPTRLAAATLSVLLFLGGVLVAQRLVVTNRLYPEQNLYVGDLVGVSLVRNESVLPADLFPAQDVNLLRARAGSLDLGALIYHEPQILNHRVESRSVNEAWAREWRQVLREHPIDYLIWRGRLYLAQLGITHGVRDSYFGGSSRIIDDGLRGSVENVFPGALQTRNDLLSAVNGSQPTGSFVVVPAWYVLIAAISIVHLGRNGRRRAATAFLLTVLAMQGLLFFTAPGTEYRLEYFQVVLGTTFGSIVVARHVRILAVRRRRHPEHPGSGVAEHSPSSELVAD
jgi:hypothetical protein